MYEGKRPGGLTALAVVNFVFVFMSLFTILGLAVMTFASKSPEFKAEIRRQQEQQQEDLTIKQQHEFKQQMALAEVSTGFWLTAIAAHALTAALLLISGIGYLKQKRILGRLFGNLYAILGMLMIFAILAFAPEAVPDTDFSLGTLVSILYPLLTLIMINGSFREDFR